MSSRKQKHDNHTSTKNPRKGDAWTPRGASGVRLGQIVQAKQARGVTGAAILQFRRSLARAQGFAPVQMKDDPKTSEESRAPEALETAQAAPKGAGAIPDRTAALHLLNARFGSLKPFDINPASIHTHADEAAYQNRYDRFEGAGAYQAYVRTHGGRGPAGFEFGGQVYLSPQADHGTIVHEILHTHASDSFEQMVNAAFREGVTDYMAQQAFLKSGLSYTARYVQETQFIKEALSTGLSKDDLYKAYLNGDLTAFKAWTEGRDWAQVNKALDAEDFDSATMALSSAPQFDDPNSTIEGGKGGDLKDRLRRRPR